jgi:hypothetical protein
MALVSLEQRRQRERADEQANKIRQELAEYDLAHSRDPIDRRRAEKQAEARAQEAREAEQSQRTESWTAKIDHRIGQWFTFYFGCKGYEKFGVYNDAMGEVLAENRKRAEAEVKKQFEDERQSVDAKLAELEARLKSIPGKLPVVKAWQPESVVYQAEMVSHNGSLWQAKRDTAQKPGGQDWVLVARHGRDAIPPSLRGTFNTHGCYAPLDVVEFDGAAYIAKRDDPGLPGHGDGWQVFGSERMDRRAEVKKAIEDERQSVDAKLEALKQASNDRWAVIDQRILRHIERARKSVLQGNSEVLRQFRAELCEEFKLVLVEKERAFDAKLAALEERLKSVPGKLPVAKTWQPENVTYQAEFVSHNGSLYQARKDTAQAPGGSDWVCVARHGRDAITPTVRGAYDVNDSYGELDIVSFDGAAYVAKSDDPGLCPGEGWERLSKRGQRGRRGEAVRGPQGEKGAKGDKGDDALEIVNWHIDSVNYRVVRFTNSGQAGKPLELRALFERFLEEVGG